MSTPEERAKNAAYMRDWWKTEAGKTAKQRRNERRAADPAYRAAEQARQRAWRLNHHEEQLAREREKQARFRAEHPDLDKERKKADRERARRARDAQADRPRPLLCEICGQTSSRAEGLVWDHCHQTGAFRGWLCDLCNQALGLARDDPKILRAMIRYLEKARRAPEKKAA